MKLRVGIVILAALVIPCMTSGAVSISMPVPADVQAALFRNIWKLDRNFDSTTGIKLAIVYQQSYFDSVTAKDEFLAAIGRQGLHITVVVVEAGTQQLLSNGLRGADVDGADPTAARFAMGDPLHGRPVTVIYGGSEDKPDLTLFAVTNDGYLHAIDTKEQERWVEGFAPEPR